MIWVNVFHAYQPPGWDRAVIAKVAAESYRPFFEWLKQHPKIRVTLNISGSLVEQLDQYGMNDITKCISVLAGRGQIELTGSAMYHPIIPLLPESIVRRQILQNTLRIHDAVGDGYAPQGFFPPELAFRQELSRTIVDSGFSWVVLDEISLDGTIGSANLSAFYQTAQTPLYCFFRNRIISDYLFFSAPLDDPADFWRHLESDGRSTETLITAMDLENLGHHRPGLDRYWQTLIENPRVTTMTVSDLLQRLASSQPLRITPRAASWATQPDDLSMDAPYPLWKNPNNPIHHLQWQLTAVLLQEAGTSMYADVPAVCERIDRALASDQYWWASATPWWDVAIIRRGAGDLLSAIRALHPAPDVLLRAENLYSAIDDLARRWHESGLADRRRTAFLQKGEIRRLGGAVIQNTSSSRSPAA